MENEQDFSRRAFLQQVGLSGIALTIGCCWPALAKDSGNVVRLNDVENTGTELLAWISIDAAGKVTIYNHRSEMGQGTWQAILQIIAEELEVSMDHVIIPSAAANPKKYGPQPQEGSFSIRGWYEELLRMGASAREMLVAAAALQWNVAATECRAENGQVIHVKTGKKLGYL
ncbi:molybdopterin cofactor-binding domain-containing protein [Dyadobacter sp. CY326]|uniref:molybdopterin cofactor-binding domain-containing protein n=1 Tax=Dyadobacter sp. CY326 TaxID=2907300 RepID=UPI001F346D2B|nr:molybdopterin cofactor-binding domain-containing protein [Dyadobacter sp. CY326]MCE7064085.1 molybdopterin-dependent oxidoreductase [Dyadobacter sp. CY326]